METGGIPQNNTEKTKNMENPQTPSFEEIEKQEMKDREIDREAQKLGTNIGALKREIEQAGGEDFWKKMNSEDAGTFYEGLTTGGANIAINERAAGKDRQKSIKDAKLAAVMILGALGLEATLQATIGSTVVMEGIEAMALLTGIAEIISAVKNRISSRKNEREAKKMKLKMDMTNTPIEIKQQ